LKFPKDEEFYHNEMCKYFFRINPNVDRVGHIPRITQKNQYNYNLVWKYIQIMNFGYQLDDEAADCIYSENTLLDA